MVMPLWKENSTEVPALFFTKLPISAYFEAVEVAVADRMFRLPKRE